MPGIKIPKNLGYHRQAGIALYRALLTQCRAVPLEPAQQESLVNIVRHRFRTPRTQKVRLALAFQVGYRALDLLKASSASSSSSSSSSSPIGDAASIERIKDLLSRTPSHLKQVRKKNGEAKEQQTDARLVDPPAQFKFLNVFPRPKVQGIRKVPFLVNANGLPFIRFKKPQPLNVSRVLRQKIEQRQRHFDYRRDLDEYAIPLAEYEDYWDEILKRESGQSVANLGEFPTFAGQMHAQRRAHRYKMQAKSAKLRELNKKMTNIVLRERQLAAMEREERIRQKELEHQPKAIGN